MNNRIIILQLFILSCTGIYAQQIENVRFEQQGKQIVIYYNLQGTPGEKYDISVYCSADGGQTWGKPLQRVSGDVGTNQTSGNAKTIIWDVLTERESLSGDIQFEVRAKTNTNESNSEKIGKYYIVAGIFREEVNANALVKQLSEKGYDSELFGKIGNLYAVCYSSFDNINDAEKELERIKISTNKEAWIKFELQE